MQEYSGATVIICICIVVCVSSAAGRACTPFYLKMSGATKNITVGCRHIELERMEKMVHWILRQGVK